jgi:two-component system sensor histidine kinase YesM
MLLSTLLPLLALGGFAFYMSSDITEAKTTQSSIDALRLAEANLRFIVNDVESLSLYLIGDRDIQQYLRGGEQAGYETMNRVYGSIANLAGFKDYIADISIIPAKFGTVLSSSAVYENELKNRIPLEQIESKMWTGLHTIRNYAGTRNVLTFVRPYRSTDNYEHLGWLAIRLDEEAISRIWSEGGFAGNESRTALIDRDGNVLSSSERDWLYQPFAAISPEALAAISDDAAIGSGTAGKGKGKITVSYVRSPKTNWTLIHLLPYEQYSLQNRYLLLLTLAAIAFSSAVNTFLVIYVIRKVTKPLRKLTGLLSNIDPEDPLPLYPVGSTDEIGKLAESYNKLGTQIRALKEQVILNEARKKEADMQALQAQINPHFLYNTLSSIHWLALMKEEKGIADMVGALSDFLRFSLNRGKPFCLVRQEIDHIRNYMRVQEIRFPDKFELDISVDPALEHHWMLKLLLQPLVENAMVHGIQPKEGKGTITVHAERRGDSMAFLVMDDGVGMPEERLNELRERLRAPFDQALGFKPLSPSGGYGLRNVHERLLLHYGPEAGLHIESRLSVGTRISFTIPILEVEP